MEIHYESGIKRLRIEGTCSGPDDGARLLEAVETFRRLADPLIVDLTGVVDLSLDLALLLSRMRAEAGADGSRIVLLRRSESQVDQAIISARDSLTDH